MANWRETALDLGEFVLTCPALRLLAGGDSPHAVAQDRSGPAAARRAAVLPGSGLAEPTGSSGSCCNTSVARIGRRRAGFAGFCQQPRRPRRRSRLRPHRSARRLVGTSLPATTLRRPDSAERSTRGQLMRSHAGPTPDGTGLRTAPPPPPLNAGGVVMPGSPAQQTVRPPASAEAHGPAPGAGMTSWMQEPHTLRNRTYDR